MDDLIRMAIEWERLMAFCEDHALKLDLEPFKTVRVQQWTFQLGAEPFCYWYDTAGNYINAALLRRFNDEARVAWDRHVKKTGVL